MDPQQGGEESIVDEVFGGAVEDTIQGCFGSIVLFVSIIGLFTFFIWQIIKNT